MLVPMKELLNYARENHFAIPAPGAPNEHALRGALAVAEEMRSPLILLVNIRSNPDICYHGRVITDLANRASVPVSVIMDHAVEFGHAILGIRAGFTDIMVDRSTLPFKENVAQVKELVRIAHSVGVGVEAELGHVGKGANYEVDGNTNLTVPSEAAAFVEETGVDSLAVAIGTAHGQYKGTPNIRFELLNELREVVPVPLVMHGGSGTGEANISKACRLGICKVNLANELYTGSLAEIASKDMSGSAVYGMYKTLSDGYMKVLRRFVDVCGSSGSADRIAARKASALVDMEKQGHNEG